MKINSYREAEEYILNLAKFAQKNTPDKVRAIYRKLGSPGNKSKIFHVAGTNGKGSVCVYASAIARAGGYTTGVFTSPHLVSMRERFRVNGTMIREEEFLAVFQAVYEQMEEYQPTFFEILFLMAMEWFEQKQTELIFLETGLGGRLDSTNIVENKIVNVITRIGLDHMEYLGDTKEAIAREKAGIMRQDVPTVCLAQEEKINAVLVEESQNAKSPCIFLSDNDFQILEIKYKSIDFSYKSRYYGYIRLSMSTPAVYQAENISLAIKAIETAGLEPPVSLACIQQAVLHTIWEGRMEEVLPGVYVDGAHNEDGIRAFAETVKAVGAENKLLVFAVVQDKDYESMIRTLMEQVSFSQLAITEVETERTMPSAAVADIFRKYTEAEILLYKDARAAFTESLSRKRKGENLYVVGSLYLVGMIKELLGRNRND